VLWGIWLNHLTSGKFKQARELIQQLLELAQRLNDSALLLEAHHAAWNTLLFSGEFVRARDHAENGISLYEADRHSSLAFVYGGHDPGVCSLLHASLALWFLGHPTQALRRAHEGLNLANRLS